MKYRTLNNGIKMPMIGFGTYQIPAEKTAQIVLEALKQGYRLIDTAQSYDNEAGVGQAIVDSKIPRQDIFITTKVSGLNAGYEQAKKTLEISMQKLQTNYIDLVLVHAPVADYYGTWKALEELYKQGKIKSIGVANFTEYQLEDLILWNEIKPSINQIELHPFFQRNNTVDFIKSKEVAVESWASFDEGKNNIFTNPVIAEIGKKYNKSNAQVILRWLIQRDITVIPKSKTPSRIKQNIEIFDFELTDEDMQKMKTLDTNKTSFFVYNEPATADLIYNLYMKRGH